MFIQYCKNHSTTIHSTRLFLRNVSTFKKLKVICPLRSVRVGICPNSYFKSIRNLTRISRMLQTNLCPFVYVNILDQLNLISENKSTTNDLSQKVLISHLINGKKTIPFFRLLFWHHSTSWYCMKIITNSFCNLRL